jgi:hypothetical protein
MNSVDLYRAHPHDQEMWEEDFDPVFNAKQHNDELIRKFEFATVELNKAKEFDITPDAQGVYHIPDESAEQATVSFQGKTIKPGSGYLPGNKRVHVLGATPEHIFAVPHDKLHTYGAQDLLKVPRKSGASIQSFPEEVEANTIVDHAEHGVPEYTKHEDVKSMVHGLDFNPLNPNRSFATDGVNKDHSFWTKNAQKKPVYVKAQHDENSFDESSKEGLYHNLARDFYGLGNYVTPTGVVRNPATGQKHIVVAGVEDGEHINEKNKDHKQTLKNLNDSGELHKLAIMNVISANHDRHRGNFLMTPGGMKLIDHGYAYSDSNKRNTPTPDYLKMYGMSHNDSNPSLHPEAAKWVQGLDPQKLESEMHQHGVPERYINESVYRLRSIQNKSNQPNTTIGSALMAPFASGVPGLDSENDTPSGAPIRQKLPNKVR